MDSNVKPEPKEDNLIGLASMIIVCAIGIAVAALVVAYALQAEPKILADDSGIDIGPIDVVGEPNGTGE